jgi:Icc-related predicted phosphoesterase
MQNKSCLLILSAFLFILLSTLVSAAGATDAVWTFVVMGDTRDRTTATLTGISPDLPRLADAIAGEHPDLVIHTGDLTNGYYTTKSSPMHGKFREMFHNWKTAVRPIYDYQNRKGIPLYIVRGNHEDGELITDEELKKAYREEFAGIMPQDGPEDEKGLTYSFMHKGAKYFALDGYYDKKAMVLRGYVNQPWLDESLDKDRRPFTFVFSHTPAYRVGDSHESPFPDLYSHTSQRDVLWQSMKKAGVIAYFCGHIHLYCRGTVGGIEQIVVGDGGADTVGYYLKNVDPALTMHYPPGNMDASDVQTGYLVMTVDEPAGKVTGVQKVWNGKTGRWDKGDIFTLTPH